MQSGRAPGVGPAALRIGELFGKRGLGEWLPRVVVTIAVTEPLVVQAQHAISAPPITTRLMRTAASRGAAR